MTEVCEFIGILKSFLSENLPSIVSLASVSIAFFAWKETIRIRKNSVKPDLVLPTSNVFLEIENSNKNTEWSSRYFGMNKNDKFYNHATDIFPINIGLGVAKEIEIEFKHDIKKMVKSINGLVNSKYEITYSKHDSDVEIMTFENKEESYRTIDSVSEIKIDKDVISHILPNHQVENKEQFIMLPDSLLKMCYYYIIARHNALEEGRNDFYVDNFEGFSVPRLEVRYRDVQNNIHKKTFLIKLTAHDTLLVGKKENEVSFFISLEYQEKK